ETDLAIAGWMTEEAGGRLLAMAGKTVGELLHDSESSEFRPVPLGVRLRVSMRSTVREMQTRNVAAIAPGSDPQSAKEAVIFSAHWDHLGIGTPVNGDTIYN